MRNVSYGNSYFETTRAKLAPQVMGICLLTRRKLRTAAWTAVGLHVVLLSAVLATLWRGIAIANYGCFGIFFARPLTGQTVAEDAVMLGLSLLVLWQVHQKRSWE